MYIHVKALHHCFLSYIYACMQERFFLFEKKYTFVMSLPFLLRLIFKVGYE